jgi:hypothetical protein
MSRSPTDPAASDRKSAGAPVARPLHQSGAMKATPLLSILFLAPACDLPVGGERTGGGCPAGEVCAPETPNGLYFAGAPFASTFLANDLEPKATAVGGTQRITVYVDPDGYDPFGAPFRAAGTGAVIAGEVEPPSVVIGGDGAGEGYLRILNQHDELHDRYRLELFEVEEVSAGPMLEWAFADFELDDYALWSGGAIDLMITLRGSIEDGSPRLVDESMTVALPPGSRPDPRWDVVQVRPQAAGPVALTITAGNAAEHRVELQAVDRVDDILLAESAYSSPESATEVTLSSSPVFCFRVVHQAESGPIAVLGAPLEYTVSGALTVHESSVVGAHCVALQTVEVGLATVTVSLDGVTRSVSVAVVEPRPEQEAAARLRPDALRQPAEAIAVGERAAAQLPVQ